MTKVQKTPAFPFYGKDAYDDETFGLASFAAQGLYMFLAWWQWQEGSIPATLDGVLAKVPRAKVTEAKRLWKSVEAFFPVMADTPTRRQSYAVETRRTEMVGKRARHSDGANKTNTTRWGTGSLSDTYSDKKSDRYSDNKISSLRAEGGGEGATVSSFPSPKKEEPSPREEVPPIDWPEVKRVLHVLRTPINPHVAATWIQKLGSADAVLKAIEKYANKNAAYLDKVIETAVSEASEKPRNDKRPDRKPPISYSSAE